MNKKTNQEVNFGLLESFRQISMEYYFQSLIDDGEEITEEVIDIANNIWKDIENYMIFNGGDLNDVLMIGLELLVETAIGLESNPEMMMVE